MALSNSNTSTKYRICKICPTFHYEDCRTCLGWGVFKRRTVDGILPVTARYQFEDLLEGWEACPECESTPAGLGVNEDYGKDSDRDLGELLKDATSDTCESYKQDAKDWESYITQWRAKYSGFFDGVRDGYPLIILIDGVPLEDNPPEIEFRPSPFFIDAKTINSDVFAFTKRWPIAVLPPSTSYGPLDGEPKDIALSANGYNKSMGKYVIVIGTIEEVGE